MAKSNYRVLEVAQSLRVPMNDGRKSLKAHGDDHTRNVTPRSVIIKTQVLTVKFQKNTETI